MRSWQDLTSFYAHLTAFGVISFLLGDIAPKLCTGQKGAKNSHLRSPGFGAKPRLIAAQKLCTKKEIKENPPHPLKEKRTTPFYLGAKMRPHGTEDRAAKRPMTISPVAGKRFPCGTFSILLCPLFNSPVPPSAVDCEVVRTEFWTRSNNHLH